MNAIRVPVPSSEEQREIARRVHLLFTIADQIESKYLAMEERVNKLPQAILRKAFRGDLIKGGGKKYKLELNGMEG